MTSFKLTAMISDTDLATIQKAAQKIVLVRSFIAQDPANVAWVVLDPASSLVAEWSNEYSLYASQTELMERNVVQVQSSGDAQSQLAYEFSGNVFSQPMPDATLEPGQYRVVNKDSGDGGLTFGMLQPISISGNPPLSGMPANASFVPRNNAVTFTPLDTVTIFLSSAVQSSQVVLVPPSQSEDVVTSPSTPLPFSADLTEITVQYSSILGSFFRL